VLEFDAEDEDCSSLIVLDYPDPKYPFSDILNTKWKSLLRMLIN